MTQRLAYAISILFTFCCFSFSHAVEENKLLFFGHDDREYVGELQKIFPYAAIGILEMESGATCTATLIREDIVLTAAHCFWIKGKSIDSPKFFWAGKMPKRFEAKYKVVDYNFPKSFVQGLQYQGEDVYINKRVAHLDIATLKVTLLSGQAPMPFPLFQGSVEKLKEALKKTNWHVSQAGYPEDEENVLKMHRQCRITGILKNLTLSHQCDTLSGDSGSPIWLTIEGKPQLIAIQSSAPDAKDRERADNVAVSVLNMRN